MSIPAPDYVRSIAPYQAGKPISELAREYGLDAQRIVKLASNENPFGMPESARAAIVAELAEVSRYPDSNGFELKAAISRHYGVDADWITLGNGSKDVLELAAHALLQPGASAVYSQYSFAVYTLATQETGARAIVVPARELGHDLDAMRASVATDTRIVFVANPNNPTGTWLPREAIAAFVASVPPDVVVVLDEAYDEYLDPGQRSDSIRRVREHPNLVVCRTFSKAYGLAGLRVGFAVAQPELTDLMNRVRQPFNVSSIAQAAAIAALDDRAYLQRSYEANRAGLQRLQESFARMGLEYVPSHGNFVLVRVGDAARVYEELLRAGIIVRPVGNYGLPDWLRISVGLPEENEAFLRAFEKAMGRAAEGDR